MMHYVGSMVTSLLSSTAVLVTAHSSNPWKCSVHNAATGEFIGSIEHGESIFHGYSQFVWDVTIQGGGILECPSLEEAVEELKIAPAFPTEAGNRNYSKAVYKETSY